MIIGNKFKNEQLALDYIHEEQNKRMKEIQDNNNKYNNVYNQLKTNTDVKRIIFEVINLMTVKRYRYIRINPQGIELATSKDAWETRHRNILLSSDDIDSVYYSDYGVPDLEDSEKDVIIPVLANLLGEAIENKLNLKYYTVCQIIGYGYKDYWKSNGFQWDERDDSFEHEYADHYVGGMKIRGSELLYQKSETEKKHNSISKIVFSGINISKCYNASHAWYEKLSFSGTKIYGFVLNHVVFFHLLGSFASDYITLECPDIPDNKSKNWL